MRLSVRVLGCEVLAVELGADDTASLSKQTVAHRHSGDFGFSTLPTPINEPLPIDVRMPREAP